MSNTNDTWEYEASLHSPMAFSSHASEISPYLAMNVLHYPVFLLKEKIEQTYEISLKDRGDEAHVTVITPPEYAMLKKYLSMEKINYIAQGTIQSSTLQPLCVGKGSTEINNKIEHTYFIVVQSDALLILRGQIHREFVEAGGNKDDFMPDNYYPHITIGFTKRDLHFSDGVVKNENTCIHSLVKKESSPWR